MAKQTAVAEMAQTEEAPVLTPMPDEYQPWETRYFDPRDLIIDHTQNGRRFGVKADKVLAMREDFLNPDIGQLQECGVYWNEAAGAFQVGLGYHRAEAALGISKDGVGPDEGGVYLLRCVILPSTGTVGVMGLNLAENSSRTRTELTPMDKAYAVSRMMENGYTQKDIAIRMGVSKALISLLKNLTDFPLKVQRDIDSGKITQAAAFELIDTFRESPDDLQKRVDEMKAASLDGKIGTTDVRDSKRKAAEEDEDGGEAEEDEDGGEETADADAGNGKGKGKAKGKKAAAKKREAKTGRSLKEVMAFLRDWSDCEKDVVPQPGQVVLKIMLKFADGKLSDKAAYNQINKAAGFEG